MRLRTLMRPVFLLGQLPIMVFGISEKAQNKMAPNLNDMGPRLNC
ncbi:hypothetical protein TNIN_172041, partial [Trichonephila inaurata madagascariensis]